MTATDPTIRKLAELDLKKVDDLTRYFSEVRDQFQAQTQPGVAKGLEWWETTRQAWLGRKHGVLARIVENWLKPAGPDWKPHVGRELNQLRAYV